MSFEHIAYLGLGSNQANPSFQLTSGIITLAQHDSIHLLNCSSYYVSSPVDHSEQPDFWNAVIAIQTPLTPTTLLSLCHDIEAKHERVRLRRWGPRTLDVDLLLYDHISISLPHCTIPHKEMMNRDFVLVPLFEIAPELILPNDQALGTVYRLAPKHITDTYDNPFGLLTDI